MNPQCIAIVFSLMSLATSACTTPMLTVRHMDPTQPVAQVWLDGARTETVQYGQEVRIPFEPGHHTINTTPPLSRTNAWSPKGAAWRVILERDATLTLLTPRRRRTAATPSKKGDAR